MKLKEYNPEVLDHLRKTQMMILKDFIQICEENNLSYSAYGGTLLGAVRHKGYIPWDDDIDVVMFRSEFEKFKEVFLSSNNDKYELLTNDIKHDYCYIFSKFMLKNTRFEEEWMNQFSFQIGFNIDIFILEDSNDNKFKHYYLTRKAFIYNRLSLVSALKLDDLPFMTKIISHFVHDFLNFFKFTPHKIIQRCLKFIGNNSHKGSKFVFDPTCSFWEFPLEFYREDFEDIIPVEFEDMYVNVPRNYDRVLTMHFGDYMTLPPEEKRVNHAVDYIEFGKY
jgi:lipopolysaccharide cholinephosphotransferase